MDQEQKQSSNPFQELLALWSQEAGENSNDAGEALVRFLCDTDL